MMRYDHVRRFIVSSNIVGTWNLEHKTDGQAKRERDKKLNILLANDASNAQGWIVDDGEPGLGITWQVLGEVVEAVEEDGFTQPRRSGKNEVRELEDDFEFDDDMVKDVEFDSNEDGVLRFGRYEVENKELETQS
ncbi:hypothetical protein LWI28_022486 [Acer negundo]|uniref:Uncharacterized protein n=1 Tax=Acer negundo TaxID=4023 RepID=A0AAD5P2V9_ACENE|nr:hypothetical protein LWI28_022486 [Acer negundo]